uniref:AMP-dependent synthetase and ligase n=1 Tax=Cyanothece sp. (strain PCC 7425 / ATCC 29141) TaxID=395961 RepID=B8HVE2_CYAP4
MLNPADLFHQNRQTNWLLVDRALGWGRDQISPSQQLVDRVQRRLDQLHNSAVSSRPLKILLVQSDPIEFLADFLAAEIGQHHLFLANPSWRQQEWQQVCSLVKPDQIWGEELPGLADFEPAPLINSNHGNEPAQILIPTGGSSGKIRFAIHTWETLTASVEGCQRYFKLEKINCCCVLPLYHVSGLMQFIRAFQSGGELFISSFKQLLNDLETQSLQTNFADFFLSLVPTQLQQLLQIPSAISWLQQFKAVLIGGGPTWPDLLEQARVLKIPLAPTYGMTETAAQIATLKPSAFLTGKSGYTVLPHARVRICNAEGEPLSRGQTGKITVETPALALGYYPEQFKDAPPHLITDDLGWLDAWGTLHLVGRSSEKIITGGENVFPIEVEAAIRQTGLVRDVCVLGLPDCQWGEVVTAVYVPVQPDLSVSSLQAAIATQLSKYKQPKRWIPLTTLPRNNQGKINRPQLLATLVQDHNGGATL